MAGLSDLPQWPPTWAWGRLDRASAGPPGAQEPVAPLSSWGQDGKEHAQTLQAAVHAFAPGSWLATEEPGM